jgi:hypothetical protein
MVGDKIYSGPALEGQGLSPGEERVTEVVLVRRHRWQQGLAAAGSCGNEGSGEAV